MIMVIVNRIIFDDRVSAHEIETWQISQPMLLILDYHLQLIQSILWTGELIYKE